MKEEDKFEALTTHRRWIESQGIPILSEFSVPNLNEIKVGPWERLGVNGAYVIFNAIDDILDAYILEIGGGGTVRPERHMYEEIIYVLSGRGAATIWNEGSPKRTFEWHEGSMFAIPLNARHQFFNAQSDSKARFYVVSSAPLLMNLFHDNDFIFNNPYVFTNRFDGRQDFFDGGQATDGRVWETNFVEDVRTFPLLDWKERGGGGINRRFELANSTLTCHVSQFPVGTYKKAHRHGPGANVIIIAGQGYSMLWEEGREKERVKIDWSVGGLLVPPDMWFHQHFNTGAEPAKYLAVRWGSRNYPLFKKVGERGKVYISVKEGGNQIEYEDEEPVIRRTFEEELAQNGVKCMMPPPASL
jgi:mannose-6-phosphate isomerase-like protein (cupin superfamily)